MTDTMQFEQPEALASFAEAARQGQKDTHEKSLFADYATEAVPENNAGKHIVAAELLRMGTDGTAPDHAGNGVHELHDRINDTPEKTASYLSQGRKS
jgi:hypothetical protein